MNALAIACCGHPGLCSAENRQDDAVRLGEVKDLCRSVTGGADM